MLKCRVAFGRGVKIAAKASSVTVWGAVGVGNSVGRERRGEALIRKRMLLGQNNGYSEATLRSRFMWLVRGH